MMEITDDILNIHMQILAIWIVVILEIWKEELPEEDNILPC